MEWAARSGDCRSINCSEERGVEGVPEAWQGQGQDRAMEGTESNQTTKSRWFRGQGPVGSSLSELCLVLGPGGAQHGPNVL